MRSGTVPATCTVTPTAVVPVSTGARTLPWTTTTATTKHRPPRAWAASPVSHGLQRSGSQAYRSERLVDEQALREIYLRAFEGAFDGGALSVMTTTGRIGTRLGKNYSALLTTVLRERGASRATSPATVTSTPVTTTTRWKSWKPAWTTAAVTPPVPTHSAS